MVCIFLKALCAMLMGACLLVVGCGKKAKENSDREPYRPPIETDQAREEYLSKQDVNCEANQACPNYITKIVIFNGDQKKFCTGFLTDENTVATSASCLPSILRQNGLNCSKDVYFFFPKTTNRPAERANCSQVTLVSEVDGQDPVLWRDDVAFLHLASPVSHRRQAAIVRDGVVNNKQFVTWMIDQQGDFSAIVKKSVCESIHNNYVNPLVLNESSPSMLFADCGMTNGGSGAPVLDNKGKVRAMISTQMDKKLREYLESTGLLTNAGLKQMVHATNFACAPTPQDNDMLDEKECLKDLTYLKVDRIRSEMLNTNMLFGDLKKKLEESLEKVSKYVRFGVKIIPKGDVQETQIYPKCFKPLKDWLSSMPSKNNYVDEILLPVRSFRRTMDAYGRILGKPEDKPETKNMVQFSLKNLRSDTQKSSVLMWLAGQEGYDTYPNLSEACSNTP